MTKPDDTFPKRKHDSFLKQFWYETARTIVLGIGAGVLTFFVLRPGNLDDVLKAQSERVALELKKAVVDDFLRSSYSYTAKVYDVMTGEKDQDAVKLEIAYDGYRSDRNRMWVYFGSKAEPSLKNADHYLRLMHDFRKNGQSSKTPDTLRANDDRVLTKRDMLKKQSPAYKTVVKDPAKQLKNSEFYFPKGPKQEEDTRPWDWRDVRHRAKCWLRKAARDSLADVRLFKTQ